MRDRLGIEEYRDELLGLVGRLTETARVPLAEATPRGLAAGAFDLRGWNPALKAGSRSRPDRAEALRRTHEAASHDAWFRAQVEEALREADDPHTAWMSHEEVTADMATQRARIMEMMAGKPGKGR